jgi:hypothetical protein
MNIVLVISCCWRFLKLVHVIINTEVALITITIPSSVHLLPLPYTLLPSAVVAGYVDAIYVIASSTRTVRMAFVVVVGVCPDSGRGDCGGVWHRSIGVRLGQNMSVPAWAGCTGLLDSFLRPTPIWYRGTLGAGGQASPYTCVRVPHANLSPVARLRGARLGPLNKG